MINLNKLIFGTLILLFIANSALAHKVTIFAWNEEDMVYTESKFAGGGKVKNAPVEVYNDKGKKLLEGKTNDSGEFSFKAPQKGKMKIVLFAGMGHRAEWTILIDGFHDSVEDIDALKIDSTAMGIKIEQKDSVLFNSNIKLQQINAEIKKIVEQSLDEKLEPLLDKKLKPMNKLLAKLQERDLSVQDILGGLGYILGLVGMATYIRYGFKCK